MTSSTYFSSLPTSCATHHAGEGHAKGSPSWQTESPTRILSASEKRLSLTTRDIQILLNSTQSVILAIRSSAKVSNSSSTRLIINNKDSVGPYSYFLSPHFGMMCDYACGAEETHLDGEGMRHRQGTVFASPWHAYPSSSGDGRGGNNRSSSFGGPTSFSSLLPRVLLLLEALQRQLTHLSSYTFVGIPMEPSPYIDAFQLFYDDIVDQSEEKSSGGGEGGSSTSPDGEKVESEDKGCTAPVKTMPSPSPSSPCSSSSLSAPPPMTSLSPLYPTITDWAVRSSTSGRPSPPRDEADGVSVASPSSPLPLDATERPQWKGGDSGATLPNGTAIPSSASSPRGPPLPDHHLLLLLPFCQVCEFASCGMGYPTAAFSALTSFVESRCSFVTVEGLKRILQSCLVATKSSCMYAEQLRMLHDVPYRRARCARLSGLGKKARSHEEKEGRMEKTVPNDPVGTASSTDREGQEEGAEKNASSASPPPSFSCFSSPYPVSATTMLFGGSVFPTGRDRLTGSADGYATSLFSAHGAETNGSTNTSTTNTTNAIANSNTSNSGPSSNGYRGSGGSETDQRYQELFWSRVAETYAACFEHPAACGLEECWYVDAARSLLRLPSFETVTSWLASGATSSSSSASTSHAGRSSGTGSPPPASFHPSSSSRTPLMSSAVETALKRIINVLYARVVEREAARRKEMGDGREGAREREKNEWEKQGGGGGGGETAASSGSTDGTSRAVENARHDCHCVNGALMMEFISSLIMAPHMSRETYATHGKKTLVPSSSTTRFTFPQHLCAATPIGGASLATLQEAQRSWEVVLYLARMSAAMASDPTFSSTPSTPSVLQLEGLFLAQQALLSFPRAWIYSSILFRPLLHVLQHHLSRALLVAGIYTRHTVVLSLILRTTHLLIQSASEALVPQIYFFLCALHFGPLASCEESGGAAGQTPFSLPSATVSPPMAGGASSYSASRTSPSSSGGPQSFHRVTASLSTLSTLSYQERQERREVVLSSLAYLCAQGDFCRFCYTHFDLSSCYPAVLPQLCDILLQQVFEPSLMSGGGGAGSAPNESATLFSGAGTSSFSWNMSASADTSLQSMQVAANFLAALNEVYPPPHHWIVTDEPSASALRKAVARCTEEEEEEVKASLDASPSEAHRAHSRSLSRAGNWVSPPLTGMSEAVEMDQAIQWTFKQKNHLIQFAILFAESPMKKGIPFLLQTATRVPSSAQAARHRQERALHWRDPAQKWMDTENDDEAVRLLEEGLKTSWLVLAEPAGGREVGECLFRLSPLLDKRALGEYLGEQGDYLTLRPEEDVLVELPSGATVSAAELWDEQREQASLEFGTASFFDAQLHAFISQFSFPGRSLLEAIRELVYRMCLPGESQKIDRIMEVFSSYWYASNPTEVDPHLNPFHSDSAAFILSFATIMLNTDLHSGKMQQPMTFEQFRNMNRQVDDGKSAPEEYLRELYEDVKLHEVIMPDMVHKVFLNDVTWNLEMGWSFVKDEWGRQEACGAMNSRRPRNGTRRRSHREDTSVASSRPADGPPSRPNRQMQVRHTTHKKPLRINFWDVLERRSVQRAESENETKSDTMDEAPRSDDDAPQEENLLERTPTPEASPPLVSSSSPTLRDGSSRRQRHEKDRRMAGPLKEHQTAPLHVEDTRGTDQQDGGWGVRPSLVPYASRHDGGVATLGPLAQKVLSRCVFVAVWRRTLLLFTGIVRGISANGIRHVTPISGGSLRQCLDQLVQSGPAELSALLTGLRGCCVVMTTAMKLVPEMVDYSYSCLVEVLWWMSDPSAYEVRGKKLTTSTENGSSGGEGGANGTTSTTTTTTTTTTTNALQASHSSLLLSGSTLTGEEVGIGRSTSLLGDSIALSKHVPCLLCLREVFSLLPLLSPYLWKSWSGVVKVLLELFVTGVMAVHSLPSDTYFSPAAIVFCASSSVFVALPPSVPTTRAAPSSVSANGRPCSPESAGVRHGTEVENFFLRRHALSETLYGQPLVWCPSLISSLFLSLSLPSGAGEDAGVAEEKREKPRQSHSPSRSDRGGGGSTAAGSGGKWFTGLLNFASQSKRSRNLSYEQEYTQSIRRVRQCIPDVRVLLDIALGMPFTAHQQLLHAIGVCSLPRQWKESGEVQRFASCCSLLAAMVVDRMQKEELLTNTERQTTMGGEGKRAPTPTPHPCRSNGTRPLHDGSPVSGVAESSSAVRFPSATLSLLQFFTAFVSNSFPTFCAALQAKVALDKKNVRLAIDMAFRREWPSDTRSTGRGTPSLFSVGQASGGDGNPPLRSAEPRTPTVPPLRSGFVMGAYLLSVPNERIPQDSPVLWLRVFSRTVGGVLSVIKEVLQQWLRTERAMAVVPLQENTEEEARERRESIETHAQGKETPTQKKGSRREDGEVEKKYEAELLLLIRTLLSCFTTVPLEVRASVMVFPLLEMLAHFLLWNYCYYCSHCGRMRAPAEAARTPSPHTSFPLSCADAPQAVAAASTVQENAAEDQPKEVSVPVAVPLETPWLAKEQYTAEIPAPLLHTLSSAGKEEDAAVHTMWTARAAPLGCTPQCVSWMHTSVNPVLRLLVICAREFRDVLEEENPPQVCYAMGVLLSFIAQEELYDTRDAAAMEDILEVALRIGISSNGRQTSTTSGQAAPFSSPSPSLSPPLPLRAGWYVYHLEELLWERSPQKLPFDPSSPSAAILHCNQTIFSHLKRSQVQERSRKGSSVRSVEGGAPPSATADSSFPHSAAFSSLFSLSRFFSSDVTGAKEMAMMEKDHRTAPVSLASPSLSSHWTYYWILSAKSFAVLAMCGGRHPTASHWRAAAGVPRSTASSSSSTTTDTESILPSRASSASSVFQRFGVGGGFGKSPSPDRSGEEATKATMERAGRTALAEEMAVDSSVVALWCLEYCFSQVASGFLRSRVIPLHCEGNDGVGDDSHAVEERRRNGTSEEVSTIVEREGREPYEASTTPAMTATVRRPTPVSPQTFSLPPLWSTYFFYYFSFVLALYKEVLFPLAEGLSGYPSSDSTPRTFLPSYYTPAATSSSDASLSSSTLPEETSPTCAVPLTSPLFPFSSVEEIIGAHLYRPSESRTSPFTSSSLSLPCSASTTFLTRFIRFFPFLLMDFLSFSFPSELFSSSSLVPIQDSTHTRRHSSPITTTIERMEEVSPSPTTATTMPVTSAAAAALLSSSSLLSNSSSLTESQKVKMNHENQKNDENTVSSPPSSPALRVAEMHSQEKVSPPRSSLSDPSGENAMERSRKIDSHTLPDSPFLLPHLSMGSCHGRLSSAIFNVWKQQLTTLHRVYASVSDMGTRNASLHSSLSRTPSSVRTSSFDTAAVLQSIEDTLLNILRQIDGVSEDAVGSSSFSSSEGVEKADSWKHERSMTIMGIPMPISMTSPGMLLTFRMDFWPITLQLMNLFSCSNDLLQQISHRHQNDADRFMGTKV